MSFEARAAWERWRSAALATLRATDPQGAAVVEAMLRGWAEADDVEPSALAVSVASMFVMAPAPGPGAP